MTDNASRINDWVRRLSQRALPVLQQSRRALDALAERGEPGATEIAEIAYRDPALCINLLQAAGMERRHHDSRAATLEQALMLLGVQRALALARDYPEAETTLEERMLGQYRQAVAHAYHASLQAVAWAEQRNDQLPSEIRTAALVRVVAPLTLCARAPRVLEQTAALSSPSPDTVNQAAHVVLGFTLNELGAGLVQTWRLPVAALEQLVPDHIDGRRMLGLTLAAALSEWAPLGRGNPELQNVFHAIADYIGKPLDPTVATVAETAHRASAHPCAGTPPPWAPLLDGNPLPSPLPPARHPTIFCLAPQAEIAARLTELCAESDDPRIIDTLRLRLRQVEPADAPISLALQALHSGYGMSRTIFLRLQPDGEACGAHLTLGCDGNPHLPDLQLKTGASTALRRYLMTGEPRWCRDDDLAQLLGLMPHPAHTVFSTREAFLAPIRCGDAPLGLLYADRGSADCRLTESAFRGFRAVTHALHQGIARLGISTRHRYFS